MKTYIIPIAALTLFLASCNQQKYATTSSPYEHDEVYYQKGDKFISDFALVDDEARAEQSDQTNQQPAEDDYYNPNATTQNGNVINNYYGNVNQAPMQMFGGSFYGSTFGRPNFFSTWNPYTGWSFGIQYGYNWGWGTYWNDPWCWNNPWYDPWGYNNFCWNAWNTPFGFYNPYWGWGNYYGWGYGNYWYNGFGNPHYGWNNGWGLGMNDGRNRGLLTGNRPSISVGSAINSSYDGGSLYTNRQRIMDKEQIHYGKQPVVAGDLARENMALSGQDRTGATSVATPNNVAAVAPAGKSDPRAEQPIAAKTPATDGLTTSKPTTKVPSGMPQISPRPSTEVAGNVAGKTNAEVGVNAASNLTRPGNSIARQPSYNVQTDSPSRVISRESGSGVSNPARTNTRVPSTTPQPQRQIEPAEPIRPSRPNPTNVSPPRDARPAPSISPGNKEGGRSSGGGSIAPSQSPGRISGGGSGGGGSVSPGRSSGGGGSVSPGRSSGGGGGGGSSPGRSSGGGGSMSGPRK